MIVKQDILRYRNRSYQRDLDDRIFRAARGQTPLDERTAMEAIQYYGLIIKVGGEHYISFANQEVAQTVLTSLQTLHGNYLEPSSRQSPLFNRRDESFRINITNDYFDYLAHADGTDSRTVLRIKTPGESKAITRTCLKRLELDRNVDLYNNREELIRDMREHGLFAVVDDSRASIFIPDDQLGKKIYNGLWMYAPELLEDQNYGNGQARYGNSISREGSARSLQEIHLSLAPVQEILGQNRISSRKIINSGNSITGDKQSMAEALASHLSLIEDGATLVADEIAIANFTKPTSERDGATVSPREAIHADQVPQYIEVTRPAGSNVIDAAHLFRRDKQIPGASPVEIEDFFRKEEPEQIPQHVSPPARIAEHPADDRTEPVPLLDRPTVDIPQPIICPPVDPIPLVMPVIAADTIIPSGHAAQPIAQDENSRTVAPVHRAEEDTVIVPPTSPTEVDTPIHELNGRHRKKSKEVPMPTTSAAIADIKPYAAYEDYKRSFGFQIKIRRDERDMRLQDVATAVTDNLSSGGGISPEQVRKWEQARELPSDEQAKALAVILIDENEAVSDKEQARRTFMQAYERSKSAFTRQGDRNDDRFAFADTLSEYRESFRNRRKMTLSLEGLASKASEHVKISITDEEEERLRSEPREFIAAVEAGAIAPSRGLTIALVAALDKTRTLSGDEKQALYTASEQSSASVATPVTHRARVNGSAHRPAVVEPEEEEAPAAPAKPREELGEEIKRVKRKLHTFFEGDDMPSLNQVALDAGFPKGSTNLIYVLMSEDNTHDPRKIGALSDTVKNRLATYLSTHGKEREVERFKQTFDEMRRVTGYTPRQAAAQSGARA